MTKSKRQARTALDVQRLLIFSDRISNAVLNKKRHGSHEFKKKDTKAKCVFLNDTSTRVEDT